MLIIRLKSYIHNFKIFHSILVLAIISFFDVGCDTYKAKERPLRTHVARLIVEISKSESPSPISQEDQTMLERLRQDLNQASRKELSPELKEGLEILDQLKPNDGLISSLQKKEQQAKLDLEYCNNSKNWLTTNGHNCNVIIREQIESQQGMGAWFIEIGDKKEGYQGYAILTGPEHLINKYIDTIDPRNRRTINPRVITNIILIPIKNQSAEIYSNTYSSRIFINCFYKLPTLGQGTKSIGLQEHADSEKYAYMKWMEAKDALGNAQLNLKSSAERVLPKLSTISK